MSAVQAVLVTGDEATADAVHAAAASMGVEVEQVATTQEVVARWASAPVVLVGGDCAARVAREAPRRRGRVYVIGYEVHDLALWSAPIGAEVIPLPQGQASLAAALVPGEDAATPVVAVVGGSGGAGASTLAVGLALAGVRRGLEVALVDLDPVGGGVDLLLGAERTPGWRWPRLVGARGEVGDIRDFLPRVDNVTVVSGARGEVGESPPPMESIRAVVGALARHHGLVVLDVGRTPDLASAATTRLAGRVVVAAREQVRAVAAAAQTARVLAESRPGVVVRSRRGSPVSAQAVASTIGVPLFGSVPEDAGVRRSGDVGRPPAGRGRWARAVDEVLTTVLESRDGD